MKKYASELDDFPDLLREVARSKKIPAAIVEKDYYLTRALQAITIALPCQFILKGGTSLSKGWNLLDRFSEDIDLLMRIDSGSGSISKGERERRLKAACTTISATPGFTAVEGKYPVETGVHRTVEFRYRSVADDLSGLSKTIKLEMGTRGGATSPVTKTIQSVVGEYTTHNNLLDLAEDLSPFDTSLQDVRRTFVEKLFAVHAAYYKDHAANRTRHYYDLFKLCGLEEVEAYAGTAEYRESVAEVKALSRELFPNQAVPDGDSFSQSPSLTPAGEDLAKLERNYRGEAHLFFATSPSLMEILGEIGRLLPKL